MFKTKLLPKGHVLNKRSQHPFLVMISIFNGAARPLYESVGSVNGSPVEPKLFAVTLKSSRLA